MKPNDYLHIGKFAEHYIISILLKRNLDVYVPVCDRKGIDLIVNFNSFYEFQVKARNFKRVNDSIIIRYFKQSDHFFVICFDLIKMNYYVVSSKLISQNCKKIGFSKKWYVIPLSFLLDHQELKNSKGFDILFS